MKLIKFQNGYIVVADYNTKEDYDSRITGGTLFYKDELKDIICAEYSPASKVSRPVLAVTVNVKEYVSKLQNLEIGLLDLTDVEKHIENITAEVNVEKLADDYVSNHHDSEVRRMYGHHTARAEYERKVNEDKKFTLDDMRNCPAYIIPMSFEEFIKSIKTEWDVEIEMAEEKLGMLTINPNTSSEHQVMQTGKLKPIINEQGFVKIKTIK